MKSDDVTGRVRTYESIVKGHNIPQPGVPESFKVLVKELQSLCLDIRVLDKDGNEIELKDEDEDDFSPEFRDDYYAADEGEIESSGYTIENHDEEAAAESEEDLIEEDEGKDNSDEEVRI